MKEIIKIEERNGQQAVSARELHQFLGSKRDFSNWIKSRIEHYQFVENQDFEVFNKFGENPAGGRPQIEYALSIEMAKELCMVENNKKGRQARQYFLACERKLKEQNAFNVPKTFYEALILAAQQQKQLEEQKKQLIEQEPKVNFADAMTASSTSCLVGELAKVITQNGYKIGQNRLFKWFRDNGYLGKWGERKNIPLQQYVEQGALSTKEKYLAR
jgi:anti-repressor protein